MSSSKMKTRTKKPSSKPTQSTSAIESATAAAKLAALPPPVQNPPHITILPKDLSSNARIIILPNPATSTASRYLIDPTRQRGYEFSRIAAPKKAYRSWLLASLRTEERRDVKSATKDSDVAGEEGYVIEKPDLMIATPIDPLFLILPALSEEFVQDAPTPQTYLSPTDYLMRLEEASPHFKQLNRDSNLEALFEGRIRTVCDSMDLGDGEVLYRLSIAKLTKLLVIKARKVVDDGTFPSSMEDNFVQQALAVPVASIRREQGDVSLAEKEEDRVLAEQRNQNEVESTGSESQQDSQTSNSSAQSVETAATSVSQDSQIASLRGVDDIDVGIQYFLRIRTVLDYLLGSYIPRPLHSGIQAVLRSTESPIDLEGLERYLAHVAKLRSEAATLHSLSDNISRKRSNIDEDDAEALERAEMKKRKKEEEELRKKNVSRGVKKLEKVDRTGMKNLSSFFGATAAKKKS